MNGLPSWLVPECEPLNYVSYSEWSRLRSCPLKAAFARDARSTGWIRGGIWSAAGNARHRLVEEIDVATRSGLNEPTSTWVRTRFDLLLGWERDRLVEQWKPASVPPVKQWPDVVYVRTRLASRLGGGDGTDWPDPNAPVAGDQHSSGGATWHEPIAQRPAAAEHAVEVWVQDDERMLRGRVDRLEDREGRLVVVDLKAGVGASPAELVSRHRDQLLFYAALVESAYGEWPDLELHPASDLPVPIPYEVAEVEEIRTAVEHDRASFNAALDAGGLFAAARPGATTCAWCPFQVVCPALFHGWGAVVAELEGSGSRAVSLAAGTVRTIRRFASATDVIIEQDVDLSVPSGQVSVTRLPAALEVEVGDGLVVCGAEVAGGSQVLRARWDSRTRVENRP